MWFDDESSIKHNGHVNRHNCVFYANETLIQTRIKQHLNQPGVTVCKTICRYVLIDPYFYQETGTDKNYSFKIIIFHNCEREVIFIQEFLCTCQ